MMGNLYYQLKECFCDSYVEWRIYVVDLQVAHYSKRN